MTLLSRFVISGHSMEPVLNPDDIVLVSSIPFLFTDPQINDIVAVKDPRDNKILIKRITKIENKKYFVEGDNKYHSTDSKEFGMIDRKKIIGKVIFS